MKFDIIYNPVQDFLYYAAAGFFAEISTDQPVGSVEIHKNKIVQLKCKTPTETKEIYNPTDFEIIKRKDKITKKPYYILTISHPRFFNENYLIQNMSSRQYIGIKIEKGQFPSEYIQFNVALFVIFWSGIVIPLIWQFIKCLLQ